MGYFVYIYRDTKGKARYIGYGEDVIRATSHQAGSHNEALNIFLASNQHQLEIAGPYGDKNMAKAVETSLISAMKPDLNVDLGETRWRFRPLGVPESFADRLILAPLNQDDLCQDERGAHSTLLVKIGDKNFEDGRKGYDLSNPPTSKEILGRIEAWWQIGRFIESWSEDTDQSPRLLLGVAGKPGTQIIIGAVFIEQSKWSQAEKNGSLFKIPTCGPKDLDARGLRGRRIDASVGLRFGSWTHQFFRILPKI